MNLAVIGSGGREHAICYKLSLSKKIGKLICIPGNAGTHEIAENISEDIDDFEPHEVNEKKAVYARHLGMTKNGLPAVNTKGLRIKELYKLNNEDFNKKEELGVSKRIKKI